MTDLPEQNEPVSPSDVPAAIQDRGVFMQDVTQISGRTRTVLVVDDTPQNLSLISDLLESHYQVKLASGGERALAIISANPPDLILLDIMMPGMDGYEVCRRLKDNPASKEIPVIFVTSLADSENRAMGLDLGAVDYLTKPIDPDMLLASVAKHIAS
jgi:putative two-component system response regulator